MPEPAAVEGSYVHVDGTERRISAATLGQVRDLLGAPAACAPPLVLGPGERPDLGFGELVLEDDTVLEVAGRWPVDVPLGYHHFRDRLGAQRQVISTPGRCHLPSRRAWGWSTQLYATRSRASWGMGDLGDLAALASWASDLDASFLLVNPMGAVVPSGPQEPSPYSPSSRRFRNPSYLRIDAVPGADRSSIEVIDLGVEARALNLVRQIDRDRVWALKRQALEAIWRGGPPPTRFEEWYDERRISSLGSFATWSAATDLHGPHWRRWPHALRRPDSAGIGAFAGEQRDRIRFHAWMQWLLEEQLGDVLAIAPLVQDLPVGFDPDGFDAWEWQDLIADGATIGAPPDELNEQGQDWGAPPFVPARLAEADHQPFIETVRSSMVAGGGLRIDHVMGLFRLWWIPEGNGADEGAFVRSAAEALLAIVAVESERSGAFVVGEDLGTVEPSARVALDDHDVLSYKVLWFESDPPERWPVRSLAAVSTHDLPTVAGLWDRSDVHEQQRLGLAPNLEGAETMRSRLAERAQLGDGATAGEAVVGAHRSLARAPSLVTAASLDDAVVEPERPNIPGADHVRPNWALALPTTLDQIREHPAALSIASSLAASMVDESGT